MKVTRWGCMAPDIPMNVGRMDRCAMTRQQPSAPPPRFDKDVQGWRDWQLSPWGRLRYRLVAQLLERHLGALESGGTVLDVGGADGADSVPLARRGLDVVVIDPSSLLLAPAASEPGVRTALLSLEDLASAWPGLVPGGADVVLCHNVVQYCDDLDSAVAAAVAPLKSGGLVSLISTNPVNHVLRVAVRDLDPEGALALLSAKTMRTTTFDHDVRRIDVESATRALAAAGCEEVARYGVLCVNHLITDDERKHDPHFAEALERLELELADRDPYRDIAAMWMLVARRR